MIDARRFAERYHAIWREITPTMELYVRRLNSAIEYERVFEPLESSTLPERRGLINEAAFELLRYSIALGSKITESSFTNQNLEDATSKAMQKVALYEDTNEAALTPLDEIELNEVLALASRTANLLLEDHPSLSEASFRPEFAGCGYIDRSEGDLLISSELVEIKAGDRPFRSIDIRQMIVYLALNYASNDVKVQHIRLCNPRRGVSITKSVRELALQVSGTVAPDLFMKLIHAFSSGEFSK